MQYSLIISSLLLVNSQTTGSAPVAESPACVSLTNKYMGVFTEFCEKGKNCAEACYSNADKLLTQSSIQNYVSTCGMTQSDLRGFLAQAQVFNSGQIKECGKPINSFASINIDKINFNSTTKDPDVKSAAGKNSLWAGVCLFATTAFLSL